jgi:hypothetical protein
VVPRGHARGFAFGVLALVEACAELWILLDGRAQDRGFFGVEQAADHDEAVALVGAALLRGEERWHAGSGRKGDDKL